MFSRGLLVKLMLAALGVTAISGIGTVLVARPGSIGRIALSSVTVVITCGLLLPVAVSTRGGRPSPLQRVWSGWVLVLAGLVLSLQWTPWSLFNWPWLPTLTLNWFGFGVPALGIAIPALRQAARADDESFRLSATVAIAGAAMAFATPLVLQLVQATGAWNTTTDRTVLIAVCMFLGTIAMALSAMAVRRPPRDHEVSPTDRRIGVVGMAAAALGTNLSIYALVDGFDPLGIWGSSAQAPSLQLMTWITSAWGVGFAAALWSALHPIGLTRWAASLPVVTCGLWLILVAMRLAFLWVSSRGGMDVEWLGRLGMAAGIAEACALMVTVVVLRMRKTLPNSVAQVQRVSGISVPCPRCQDLMRLAPGENTCCMCGLVVLLDFRDDRCPACRYDLRGAVVPACPECGRPRQMPAGLASP